MKRILFTGIVLVLLAGITLIIAKYNRNDPFVYICIAWVCASLAFTIFSKVKWFRLTTLYLMMIFAAFGIMEFKTKSKDSPIRNAGTYISKGFFQRNDKLGFAPRRDVSVTIQRYYQDSLLFDVRYQIDQNGWRNSTESADDSASTILFFGGSFTFGSGLDYQHTLPASIKTASNGNLEGLNYSFIGYGSHQMLAILEQNLESRSLGRRSPEIAVYSAIPHHIIRCTGNSAYDFVGPYYKLENNSEVRWQGPFHNFFTSSLLTLVSKSHLLKRLIFSNDKFTINHLETYFAIVAQSQRVFKERYNGDFYVVFWPIGEPFMTIDSIWFPKIIAGLTARGIKVIDVREIIPDLLENRRKYLFPYDGHPTAIANQKIARYLANLFAENLNSQK